MSDIDADAPMRRARPVGLARWYGLLLGAIVAVLVLESLRGSATLGTSPAWPTLQALVSAGALGLVWRNQDRLRLAPLLGLVILFQTAWITVHLILHVQSDFDSIKVYPVQGKELLDGHYPVSEYPPGAVLLFALESLLGRGTAEGVRVANAFVMIPFQLVSVAAVWALRTRWSAFFACLVGLWPLNAFFWEFKFDLAPTAALAIGLVLGWRQRWFLAGISLGLGAALKWTPALSALALVLWLLASRRSRDAAAHALGFAGAFLLVNAPFLSLWPTQVVYAYRHQGGRSMIAESFPYLPLHLFGLARQHGGVWDPVTAPAWGSKAAVSFQMMCLVAVFLAAIAVRHRRDAGIVCAALAPVVFLLGNRVFSPQYLVTMTVAWAMAGAIVARSSHEEAGIAILIFGATLANVLVFPTLPFHWAVFSAAQFLFGFLLTLWLLVTIVRRASGAPPIRALDPISGSGTLVGANVLGASVRSRRIG